MAGIKTTHSHEDVTIEKMDYGYIEKCSNEKELESIFRALISGREGHYPDLVEHCERKLQSINPGNRALRKQQPTLKARDLKMEEQQNLNNDMEKWMDEMNSHDMTNSEDKPHVNGFGDHNNLAPVRGSHVFKGNKKEGLNKGDRKTENPNRIKGSDYKAWDKFDVEKECEKINGEKEKAPPMPKAIAQPDEIDASGLTEAEREITARREKDKGNDAFKSGDFEEALSYYCRSISLQPIPATYNNRALVHLRLERWQDAKNDCNIVLNCDGEGENLKAMLRRATACTALGSYSEAKADLIFVLDKEPNNARAKSILAEVTEKMGGRKEKKEDSQDNKDESLPAKQGKRMEIQEIDGDSEEDTLPPVVAATSEHLRSSFTTEGGQLISEDSDDSSESPKQEIQSIKAEDPFKDSFAKKSPPMNEAEDSVITTNGNAEKPSVNKNPFPLEKVIPPPTEPKFPSSTENLRTKAEDLFQSGSYTDACEHYTKAIESLSPLLKSKNVDRGHELACAVLYNNRAACWLKQGSDRACVDDCTKVLEIKIWDTKAFLHRAVAYEHMEKYSLAWADFQSAYNMDRDNSLAQNGANRTARHLREIHGLNWRKKVPKVHQYPHNNSHEWMNTQPTNQQNEPPSSTLIPMQDDPFVPEKFRLKVDVVKQPLSEEMNEMSTSRASLPVGSQTDNKGKPKDNGRKSDTGATKKTKSSRKRNKSKSKSSRNNVEKAEESEKEMADKEEKRIKIRQDLFEKLKSDGNDFVKKGRYESAIECYTRCVNLCPKEPVSYTNRALCFLKLKKHISAIIDCSEAIKLEPVNVKAYYRRALARKSEGYYKDAERDIKKLLAIDPSNKAAKVELEALKKSAWDAARSKQNLKPRTETKRDLPRKKQLLIEEVDSSSSDEGVFILPKEQTEISHHVKTEVSSTEKEETTSKSDPEDDAVNMIASDGPVETSSITSRKIDGSRTKITASTNIPAMEGISENMTEKSEDLDTLVAKEDPGRQNPADRPLTPYEFGNAWNSVTDRKNVTAYKALLDQVAPKDLPTLISNKIDDHVIKVIAIVALECIKSNGDYQRAYDMMLHLTKATRFKLAAMFLTGVDQNPLVSVFEAVSECTDRTYSKQDLTNLKKLYCLP